MLIPTQQLLKHARERQYAIGAFNVYTLEGVRAVVEASEESNSPVILQVLPKAVEMGGTPLIALCLEAARVAATPISVHLDHCSSSEMITKVLNAGISSVMADGSHFSFEENIEFTRQIAELAATFGKSVEAELGKLSGSEDGSTVAEREASLTDPAQAALYVEKTGVDALAVCIGNVHGTYDAPPQLDFDRLADIAGRVSIPLVLHGTSGLPDGMILRSVALGVCKFNVNTELRNACLKAGADYLSGDKKKELVERMQAEIQAMKEPVRSKIDLFGSTGMAKKYK